VAFSETTSSKLIEEADSFLDLSEHKQKFLMTDRRMAAQYRKRKTTKKK
jgi:hypothetical protein